MIAIIDNYDSFTYNLYQAIGKINRGVRVFRNDSISLEQLESLDISHLIISPGPGYPSSAGISVAAIRHFYKKLPILGVCLGHQSIGEAFGGRIVKAAKVVHGKNSLVVHNGGDIFTGIENPMDTIRYHSLVIDRKSIPDSMVVTAETIDGEVMAIKHAGYPIFGVQFHPESVYTPSGEKLIRNFLNIGMGV